MSSTRVMNNSSPFTSTLHQPTTPYNQLTEEPFDSSFPFLNSDNGMDYYFNSPAPGNPNEDNMNVPRSMASQGSSQRLHGEDQAHEDVPMTTAEGDIHNLSLSDKQGQDDDNPQEISNPFSYAQYNMHFNTPVTAHQTPFHPYRTYNSHSRSPPYSHSPPQPLSPPLSNSPPGSSSSRHHLSLVNTPPAISPSMVSPASAMDSTLPDMSPPGVGWTYPLPIAPGAHSVYGGTPLSGISGSPGAGLSMVAGFPYPTAPSVKSPKFGRTTRPKSTRHQTSASTIKKEKDEADSDSDDDDGGRRSKGGLGLNAEGAGSDGGREIISGRREDVRKARIESEQRRRDELREGFKRLKEALPQSNQRSSKSSLLDRSVAHIQQIESANHYLLAQLEAANAELVALRNTNAELVHAVAIHTRAGSGSSPASNGGRP